MRHRTARIPNSTMGSQVNHCSSILAKESPTVVEVADLLRAVPRKAASDEEWPLKAWAATPCVERCRCAA
eukprot:6075644-Amphidinium_carterae.1